MPDPLITLTTDFGDASPYVASVKGVILTVNPTARLIDLTHRVPPQGLRHAAYFLASAVPCFPPGTLHVVVVDPGVGSERALLYVEVGGQRLLVPDNGCWTSLDDGTARAIRLEDRRYWRPSVSATFHGRDILGPVAGHLSLGLDPQALGPPVSDWVRLPMPQPRQDDQGIAGEVIFVDEFGNLISNIIAKGLERPDTVTVGRRAFRRKFRWARTYTDATPGSLVVLASSNGLVEVAVVQGNAARRLKAGVGTPLLLGYERRV